MVTCLRMPEKRSDGIWVTECCSVAWEGSVDFICCPVAGKAASLYLAQFDPSTGLRVVTDSLTRGLYSTVVCPEYWPHTNPLPCFGFCCLSWERVSFLGLADLDSAWTRLASNLEQSATNAFPVLGLQMCTTTSGLFFVLRTLQTQFLSKESHWMFEESWLDLNFLHSISLVWASPKVLLPLNFTYKCCVVNHHIQMLAMWHCTIWSTAQTKCLTTG